MSFFQWVNSFEINICMIFNWKNQQQQKKNKYEEVKKTKNYVWVRLKDNPVKKMNGSLWVLNSGPFACKAGTMPQHHCSIYTNSDWIAFSNTHMRRTIQRSCCYRWTHVCSWYKDILCNSFNANFYYFTKIWFLDFLQAAHKHLKLINLKKITFDIPYLNQQKP